MIDSPRRPRSTDRLRIDFYRQTATKARERAKASNSNDAKFSFLQIADSYDRLADAVEDLANKRLSSE
jgi:hypothetical protein